MVGNQPYRIITLTETLLQNLLTSKDYYYYYTLQNNSLQGTKVLREAGCGYPHLWGGCGNLHCYAYGCREG